MFVFGLSSLVGYRASWRDAFDTFVQEMKNFRLEKTENLTLLSASLHAQPELYGRLALDQCTGCLCLDWIDQRQIRHTGRSYDTLVFFKNSMFASEMIRVGLKNQLRHCYQLADTDVLLLSNRELPAVISGRALLKPANLWLSLAQIAPLKAVRLSDGTIAQLQTDGCVLAWGPNVQLPEGTYRAEFSIESVSQADGKISAAQFFSEPVAQLTVTSQAGNFKNASSEVNGGSLPVTAVLEWNVDHAQRDERFEFRVDSLGRGRIRIRSIEVERL